MAWIIWTIIAGILGIGLLIVGSVVRRVQSKDSHRDFVIPTWWFGAASGVIGIIWVITSLFASIHSVDYGHVGIVREFGAIKRIVPDDGWEPTWPWQNFEQENVQIQSLLNPGDCYGGRFKNCFETFSVESIDVYVIGVLNFQIDSKNVRTLREQIGPNYIQKVILPRVHQVLKDETVKYAAIEITPNREKIRNAIRERLTRELAADGILVTDFLLQNVDFKDEIKAAIDKKVIADQEAVAAERQVAVAKAQADQVAATAQGAADKLRIEAQGQADANRLVSQSLTPELIQFQAVQKLAPNVQIAFLPSGLEIILDPANMLGTKK